MYMHKMYEHVCIYINMYEGYAWMGKLDEGDVM